jgi:hypothetical protein
VSVPLPVPALCRCWYFVHEPMPFAEGLSRGISNFTRSVPCISKMEFKFERLPFTEELSHGISREVRLLQHKLEFELNSIFANRPLPAQYERK